MCECLIDMFNQNLCLNRIVQTEAAEAEMSWILDPVIYNFWHYFFNVCKTVNSIKKIFPFLFSFSIVQYNEYLINPNVWRIKQTFFNNNINQGYSSRTSGNSNFSSEIKLKQQVWVVWPTHSPCFSFCITLMTTLSVPISSVLQHNPFFKFYDSFNCSHLLPDRPTQQPLLLTCVDVYKEVYWVQLAVAAVRSLRH